MILSFVSLILASCSLVCSAYPVVSDMSFPEISCVSINTGVLGCECTDFVVYVVYVLLFFLRTLCCALRQEKWNRVKKRKEKQTPDS